MNISMKRVLQFGKKMQKNYYVLTMKNIKKKENIANKKYLNFVINGVEP